MEDVIKQRIRNVLEKFNVTVYSLSKECCLNQKTLNNQINAETQLSASTILLVLNKFPNISAEWLLRGKGQMTIDEAKHSNLKEDLKTLSDRVSRLEQIIQELKP